MNDEIKEILNQLEIVGRKHTIEICEDGSKIETMPASVVNELRLNNYSAKILLDYITNLQKENEELKQDNIIGCKKFIKQRQIIDKAIEWVKEHIETYQKNEIVILDWDNFSDPRKLLKILGGDE